MNYNFINMYTTVWLVKLVSDFVTIDLLFDGLKNTKEEEFDLTCKDHKETTVTEICWPKTPLHMSYSPLICSTTFLCR